LPGYGVISYTRSYVRAAAISWADKDYRAIESFEDFVAQFNQAYNPNVRQLGDGEWKIDKERVVREATAGENLYGKELILKAAAWLRKKLPDMTSICITGHGPYKSMNKGDGDEIYGCSHERADPPFRSVPVYKWVRDSFKESGREVPDVIILVDVATMAISGFWETVESDSLKPDGKPHVVASYIISQGIGGAFVHGFGEPVGQHYHAEVGHMRAAIHPEDTLVEGGCAHDRHLCITGRASLRALGGRIRAKYGDVYDPAIIRRVHREFDDHLDIWNLEAYYLGLLCQNGVLTIAPTKIIFGGSLFKDMIAANDGDETNVHKLLQLTREHYLELLNNNIGYEAAYAPDLIAFTDRGEAMLRGGLLALMRRRLIGTRIFGDGRPKELGA
jgi:predicted NBD/HSP70 family sugar kinase